MTEGRLPAHLQPGLQGKISGRVASHQCQIGKSGYVSQDLETDNSVFERLVLKIGY